MRFIILKSDRNTPLLEQLNSPQYKDYAVIAILRKGLEDTEAYLEYIPPTTTETIKNETNKPATRKSKV